ncbi:hypothetical protein ABGB18_45660 [Nonomuraea sp. B12E4]|uniref:hypothetical protein n=1 Tax=Nonomuraea sp. B12E4 TaxID=3153564 RepID=UPI00325E4A81
METPAPREIHVIRVLMTIQVAVPGLGLLLVSLFFGDANLIDLGAAMFARFLVAIALVTATAILVAALGRRQLFLWYLALSVEAAWLIDQIGQFLIRGSAVNILSLGLCVSILALLLSRKVRRWQAGAVPPPH